MFITVHVAIVLEAINPIMVHIVYYIICIDLATIYSYICAYI